MIKNRTLWAVMLVAALAAAACGGDDSAPDATEATTTTQAPVTTEMATTTMAEDMDDDEPMDTTTTAATTTMAPDAGDTDGDMDDMMDIAVDVGVDLDAGVIRVGMLSDLTGPFGALVTPIVTGHQAYWQDVNSRGGINGLTVELVVRDTQYTIDNHVQMYAELKDDVVAFGHSTGSPHTVAINESLQEDGILAIPLTWYSGWSDPALNSNLVPHGVPYCIEAMNSIDYIVNNRGGTTIAIASLPGDYGLDSASGAAKAAAALGLDVVYDGSGSIIPGEDLKPIADEIVASGADIAFITATPGTFSEIYGQAIAQGYEATWSGALPSWNPAYIAPDSAIKDAIERDWVSSGYISLWSSPRAANMRDLILAYDPDAVPHDYYGEGIVEATILHQALERAYENGDMTQGGVLAAAKSLESVDFGDFAPSENYAAADANEGLQRTSAVIFKPSQADLAAGGTGTEVLAEDFVSDTARDYDFTAACYSL